MKAASLRHRITFLSPVANRQPNGENLQTWTPALTLWGSLQQLRGNYLTLAQAKTETATSTHSLIIRYNPDVTQTMRVQYGQTYEDFDDLSDNDFDGLTSAEFDVLQGDPGALPVIYTINSIEDQDTRRKQLTLLLTTVRA